MAENKEDDIPTLQDVLRPGDGPRRQAEEAGKTASETSADDCPLSEAEIEAIASRVIERHTERMQEAVTRAIRQAIDLKQSQQDENGSS